jgi:hypothetical protein
MYANLFGSSIVFLANNQVRQEHRYTSKTNTMLCESNVQATDDPYTNVDLIMLHAHNQEMLTTF